MTYQQHEALSSSFNETHSEELDVVKDMIIVGKVIAWNDIHAGILLNPPVGVSESFALVEQFFLGELASPVGLCCFLEVSVDTLARESEYGSVY